MRSILLLLLGVPIPIILLIGLFSHFWTDRTPRTASSLVGDYVCDEMPALRSDG